MTAIAKSQWIFETISSDGTNPQNSGFVKVEATQQTANSKGLSTLTVWSDDTEAYTVNNIAYPYYSFEFNKPLSITKYRFKKNSGYTYPTNWGLRCDTFKSINISVSEESVNFCSSSTCDCTSKTVKEFTSITKSCKKLTIRLTTTNKCGNWEFGMSGIDFYGSFDISDSFYTCKQHASHSFMYLYLLIMVSK